MIINGKITNTGNSKLVGYKKQKIWKASWICVSSLCRGHANLCIIPTFYYMCCLSEDGIIQFLSFCDCLISFSVLASMFIQGSILQNFLPFEGWIIFHCTDRPFFDNLFICRWGRELLLELAIVDNALWT